MDHHLQDHLAALDAALARDAAEQRRFERRHAFALALAAVGEARW